MELKKVKK